MSQTDKRSARFKTEDDGLGHVLRDHPLQVPIYQRSYAWTQDQVQQFWDDLKSAMSVPQPEYFMGTLVLAPGDDGRLSIIDGQQRLVTAAILLSSFRNYFRQVGDLTRAATIESDYLASRSLRSGELEPRLLLNLDDATYFNEVVIRGEDDQSTNTEHASTIRIQEALELLTGQVAKEVREAGRNWSEVIFNWIEFLSDGVRVIVVTVGSESDAFLIFETLNDRGIILSISDLLKNYLFGLADSHLAEFQESWLQIVGAFESPGEEETLTSFIRHFWSSVHGATRERDLYRQIRSEVRSSQQAVATIGELEREAPTYAALLDSDHEKWLAYPTVTRAEVETLLRFGLEQIRPLLLAAMSAFSNDELRLLIRAVISWSVRGLIAGGIGGGVTERYYSDCAVAITDGQIVSAAGVFEQISPIVVTDEVFQASFSNRRLINSGLAKYYLLGIERLADHGENAAFISNYDWATVTIDRIIPRRADPAQWAPFEPSELGQWAVRLGNAILTEKGSEIPSSAESWLERRPFAINSPFEISREVSNTDLWTPDAINERQYRLAQKAIAVWPRFSV